MKRVVPRKRGLPMRCSGVSELLYIARLSYPMLFKCLDDVVQGIEYSTLLGVKYCGVEVVWFE